MDFNFDVYLRKVMTKYPEYKNLSLSQIGKDIQKYWEEKSVFEKSISTREGAEPFVFYEGPPSANGMPGIHHVMARAIKDIFCRYQTLKGKQVKRKAGWDTHGLPIELAVEKTLGIKKEDIGTKISVEDYNKACRREVMKYTDKWEELTAKMGYWVDMKNPYVTYDNKYIESVWWLLKNLYDKKLLYKGYTIQPYSPAAGTGLSSHELNQPGCYKNVKDTSAVVQFGLSPALSKGEGVEKLKKVLPKENDIDNIYFLAWTTTPWTLPSNTALAVGKNIIYQLVKTRNGYNGEIIYVILAKERFTSYFSYSHTYEVGQHTEPKVEEWKQEHFIGSKYLPFEIIAEFKGSELEGIHYEQLLPFGANKYIQLNGKDLPFNEAGGVVVLGDFVTTEDGTGIVHIAPSFGTDDYNVARKNNIGSLTLVDKRGKFLPEVSDGIFLYGDEYVKEAYLTDEEKTAELTIQKEKLKGIIKDTSKLNYLSVDERIVLKLQNEGKLFKKEKYEHNYPHCWRTDKPVLYYPLDSWFIKVTAVSDRMVELNKTINWKPESTGTGRFGNWLENANDWNLSRSRFWGIPLPIWRTSPTPTLPKGEGSVPSEEICIGSVEQLKSEIEKAVKAGFMQKNPLADFKASDFSNRNYESFDLHKPYADEIILVSPSGKKMFRENDLIDVWFDSGAMPYAQLHYPFSLSLSLSKREGNKPGYQTTSRFSYHYLKDKMLELKKNTTQAEAVLWEQLRAKKLEGYKFRRQHAIDEFVVDFVCLEKRLIIEVDGKYHNDLEVIEADKQRTQILNSLGYKVIRFANEEVIGNIDIVIENVWRELCYSPSLPSSLPPIGEIKKAPSSLPSGEGQGGAFSPPIGGVGGGFPADFIAEGVDQTRGWFYTLHAIATMCFDSVAYKNVISNGLVLDKNGNKMSKRLGNAVDPFETIEKYGPDATRWYMITNAAPWDNLKFDVEGITEVQRGFFGKLYNTYSFFALYANIDSFIYREAEVDFKKRPVMDRWILSELNTLINTVDRFYNDYEPHQAGRAIEQFIEILSNWYVRLNRRRFWKGNYTEDKISAYQTLYKCLEIVAQLASPIAPFFTERLYQDLNSVTHKSKAESIHLSTFPQYHEEQVDIWLEEATKYHWAITELALSIRKKENIRVRQPLGKLIVAVTNDKEKEYVKSGKGIILSEINVKELLFADEYGMKITKTLKLNFKTLGKKCGKDMKAVQAFANENQQAIIEGIEKNGKFVFPGNEAIVIEPEDIEVMPVDIPGWKVASNMGITVALDITLTSELKEEGVARELINRIQNLRKDKAFEVTDKILLKIQSNQAIDSAVSNNLNYICSETLASSLELVANIDPSEGLLVEVNDDVKTLISISKFN